MKVWAVTYKPDAFPDELYQRALLALDHDSQIKIRKFHKKGDACRCLIGRILRNSVLIDHGINPCTATFALTETGKPYVAYPESSPPVAYNIAHDNALVAIAISSNAHNPPAYSVGIDIMRVGLPGRTSLSAFIDTMSQVLTPLERQQVTAGKSENESLRRFFWSWTMKEAYTKALGLGLVFDFRRVEFDSAASLLRVDGTILTGWRILKFVIHIEPDDYQGVVAEYEGGDHLEIIHESTRLPDYLQQCDATSFVGGALQRLGHS